MAGFTDGTELLVLANIFRGGDALPITSSAIFCAYSATTGTECADATYVRQRIYFTNPAAGAMTSSGAVTFPAQTAGGNVVECSLWTASGTGSGTQLTDWKALTGGTVALSAGQQFRIPAGDYDLTLD